MAKSTVGLPVSARVDPLASPVRTLQPVREIYLSASSVDPMVAEKGVRAGVAGGDHLADAARPQGRTSLGAASRVSVLPALAVIGTETRGFVFRVELG